MTHSNGTVHGTSGALFEIENLHVTVEGREILRGLNLTVSPGEIHALMGRNGSGKSTLANALMGHPKYLVTRGNVRLAGENILTLRPDELRSTYLQVADRDCSVVGLAQVKVADADADLLKLFVEPALQRSGVGRLLLSRLPA